MTKLEALMAILLVMPIPISSDIKTVLVNPSRHKLFQGDVCVSWLIGSDRGDGNKGITEGSRYPRCFDGAGVGNARGTSDT